MSYRSPAVLTVAHLIEGAGFGNSGIVGNLAHQSRASYHNGKDVILAYHRTAESDYTIRHPRDVAGLTDAASALDISAGGRSIAEFRKLGNDFAKRCQAGLEPDISEFIWSPDGVAIRYWDGRAKKIRIGGDGTGWGDNSHRSHHHAGWFRDAEHKNVTAGWTAVLGGQEVLDMLAVATATLLGSPAPRAFTIPAGVTVNGYDPAQPGKVVKTFKASAASSAHADAEVSVSWPGTTNPPIPRGGPFLRVVDGVLAGTLIVKALVTLAGEDAVVPKAELDKATKELAALRQKANADLLAVAVVARDRATY